MFKINTPADVFAAIWLLALLGITIYALVR